MNVKIIFVSLILFTTSALASPQGYGGYCLQVNGDWNSIMPTCSSIPKPASLNENIFLSVNNVFNNSGMGYWPAMRNFIEESGCHFDMQFSKDNNNLNTKVLSVSPSDSFTIHMCKTSACKESGQEYEVTCSYKNSNEHDVGATLIYTLNKVKK